MPGAQVTISAPGAYSAPELTPHRRLSLTNAEQRLHNAHGPITGHGVVAGSHMTGGTVS